MALSCCDSSYDRIPQWLFNHFSCTNTAQNQKYIIQLVGKESYGHQVWDTFLLATQHQNNSLKIATLQYLTTNYLCTSDTNNLQLKRQGNQWKQIAAQGLYSHCYKSSGKRTHILERRESIIVRQRRRLIRHRTSMKTLCYFSTSQQSLSI